MTTSEKFLKVFDLNIPSRFVNLKETIYPEEFKSYRVFDGAFITGDVGTGKTVLSFQIARESFKKRCEGIKESRDGWGGAVYEGVPSFKRVVSVEMIVSLQNFSEKENPLEKKIEEFKTVDILTIDDLGTEKVTDFVQQCIYDIINFRYENNKETIITSNKTLNDLDDRIASRIAEMCRVIKLTGKDMRVKK